MELSIKQLNRVLPVRVCAVWRACFYNRMTNVLKRAIFLRIAGVSILLLLISGCSVLSTLLPTLGSAPSISAKAHVGDQRFKGAGAEQNVKANHGQIVGGDNTHIADAKSVKIENTEFSVFHTLLYTLILIAGVIGWMVPQTPQELIKKFWGKNG